MGMVPGLVKIWTYCDACIHPFAVQLKISLAHRRKHAMHRLYEFVVGALLVLIIFPAALSAEMTPPHHNLKVSFDLEQHTLIGISTITVSDRKNVVIGLAGLTVKSVTLNGLPLAINTVNQEIPLGSFHAGNTIRVEYSVAAVSPPQTDTSHNAGVVSGNLIGPEGIVLTGNWYPSVNGPAVFALTATLPLGFEGIAEADEIVARDTPGGLREFAFQHSHPVMGIHLAAARYVVSRETYNNIDIYSYFLPEDAGLARNYSEYTKKYLDLYEGLLGKYPYRRFSIVENILPTGYSMPTFTLLGQDIVRLPFIAETSLGHEILHQWFGNGVYADYSRGNWTEGLATYLADHLYEDLKGGGAAYRRQMLTAYQSAVTPEKDFSLAVFSGRTDRASAAVGYSKAGMVFHMLRELVGEEAFRTALRRFAADNLFKTASWLDIQAAFEAAAQKKLGWFFTQWIDGKGMPELELQNVVMSYRGAKAVVSFDLSQKGKAYSLRLPVVIRSREGTLQKFINVEKEVEHIELEVDGAPVELVIDGQFDLFRKFSAGEYPVVLARLINNTKKIAVVPAGREKDFAGIIDLLKKEGFVIRYEQEITHDDMKQASLLILGSDSPLAARIFGKLRKAEGDFSVVVRENPYSEESVIACMDYNTPEDIARYFPRILHYGKYSTVAFKNGRNTVKEITPKQEGLRAELAAAVPAVEITRLVDLQGIIGKVGSKKIVYAGEVHDRFDHHRAQFELIRGLHRKNGKIAIGMEMFQLPFQKVLDAYIAGEIGEKEFLKKSEYFKRWSFDYNLYREILLYAREYKIPVVALNIRKELVSKVSKAGMLALTKDELGELPADMDFTDDAYRQRLKETFLRHMHNAERNFDFFYQSQVLWDESMAHTLDAFLQKNPAYQMVVLAGGGHMAFGSGIPRRAFRLNGFDYSIILNSDEPGEQIADFILFSEPVAYRESPRLMVQFKEEEKRLVVIDFPKESISEKAGLKKGDVVLSLDGVSVEDVSDVKIHLLDKKKGESVVVKVRRSRFLLGDRELLFVIKL
ncbi:MAG: hypothetical protein C0402_06040 [Thermodesulfovibrio sp.]|nr:hypothetical protein [Thermodesulfovibrio sp.]